MEASQPKKRFHRLHTARKKAYQNKAIRYIFSGGTATLVDVSVFFMIYNFVLHQQDFVYEHIRIASHVIALCVSFLMGLSTNFLITKYFVFSESALRGRDQFARYLIVAAITFVGNYFMMKMLVEVFGVWPTAARLMAVATIALLSYRLHKAFTFKVKIPKS